MRVRFRVSIQELLETPENRIDAPPRVLGSCVFFVPLLGFFFLITEVQTKRYRTCILIFTDLKTHARFCSLLCSDGCLFAAGAGKPEEVTVQGRRRPPLSLAEDTKGQMRGHTSFYRLKIFTVLPYFHNRVEIS